MQRGEVWWAELPPPTGRRPLLLISRDQAIQVRELVTVAPLTSTNRHLRVEVPLGPGDGVPKACVVNLDVVTTVHQSALQARITTLSPEKMAAVNDALKFALAIP